MATRAKIYAVVEVWRGIAEGVSNFRRLSDAQKYMQLVRRRQNPMENEVKLFVTFLRVSR